MADYKDIPNNVKIALKMTNDYVILWKHWLKR